MVVVYVNYEVLILVIINSNWVYISVCLSKDWAAANIGGSGVVSEVSGILSRFFFFCSYFCIKFQQRMDRTVTNDINMGLMWHVGVLIGNKDYINMLLGMGVFYW